MQSCWTLMALLVVCVPLRLVAGEQEAVLSRYARSEGHMGVEFEVVLYASSQREADAAIDQAMARIAALNKTLSDYDLESELSKLSASSTTATHSIGPFPAVRVSDDLWSVLSASQRISAASDGAFDITLGQLTKLWRRARRWKELPEAEALAKTRATVGYQNIRLNAADQSVQLLRPDMRLDLGGIAKGYAADEALAVIKKCGFQRALVRASGDIAVGEAPPGETGWRIGIAPLDPNQPPHRFVILAKAAISTSGDAQQHLVVNGRRYSHILDPRSGMPVEGRSSVTVIAPTGTLADGLATAASVLGPDSSPALVGKFPEVALLLVHEDGSGRQRLVESGSKMWKFVP